MIVIIISILGWQYSLVLESLIFSFSPRYTFACVHTVYAYAHDCLA